MAATPTRTGGPRPPASTSRSCERSLRRPRTLFNYLLSLLTGAADARGTVPAVFGALDAGGRGGRGLSLALFTELAARCRYEQGGGFGNAIVGTLIIVAHRRRWSACRSGMLAAIYLAEFGARQPRPPRRCVSRQGADRLSVDSGRRVRLRGDRAGDGRLFGAGRRQSRCRS